MKIRDLPDKIAPGWILCAVVFGMVVLSCGVPEFGLRVYYSPTGQGSSTLTKPTLQSLHFFVRSTSDPKQTAWRSVLQRDQLQLLPALPCSEKAPTLALGLLPGTWSSLPAYVEVLGFQEANISAQNGVLPKATVSGRFALETICQISANTGANKQASVFFAPPDSITLWKGANASNVPDDWSQRMGHQVTRLPDGRYLITGGVRSLKILPAQQDVYWQAEWNTQMAVYQPNTGDLVLQDVGIKRAFFTAIWHNQQLYLIGGLGPGAAKEERAVLSNQIEVLSWQETSKQWVLRQPTSQEQIDTSKAPQRAFHTTLELPASTTSGQTPLFQQTLLGGLSALPPQAPASDAGLQVLFHSVVEVPALASGDRMIVMTGGIYRNDNGSFSASQAGFSFSASKQGKLQPVSQGEQISPVLFFPRAGHVSVALSPNLILVLGGFQGNFQDGREFVSYVEFLQRQADDTWKSIAHCEPVHSSLLRRIFASATVLHRSSTGAKILIAGGTGDRLEAKSSLLVDWNLDEKKSPCQQVNVQVLNEPYQANLWGLHSATVLDTGQVLLIGGSLFFSNASTIFEGKGTSVLFNPATSPVSSQNSE